MSQYINHLSCYTACYKRELKRNGKLWGHVLDMDGAVCLMATNACSAFCVHGTATSFPLQSRTNLKSRPPHSTMSKPLAFHAGDEPVVGRGDDIGVAIGDTS